MGVHTNTYILVGVALPERWGYLETDGQGDQDEYDDWHDRYGDLVIYEPKRGDLVHFTNIDGGRPHLGRVIAFDHGKWSSGTEFDEAFDVERVAQEIAEVSVILAERFGLDLPVKLYVYSNVT